MAVPGVIASTFILGGIVNTFYSNQAWEGGEDFGWPTEAGIMLGVILSATDPVAVVALLKDLGVKQELAIGIEAESLFNDGTALVFFQVLFDLIKVPAAVAPTANTIVYGFLWKAVGGALWGVLFGVAEWFWLQRNFNSPVIEITITLTTAYLAFFSARGHRVLGVLAVVALGLFMGKEGKVSISPEVGHFLEEFWEMLAFFGNTVVFVIAGLAMSYRLGLFDGALWGAYDLGVVCLLYVVSTIVRGCIVCLVWAFEARLGNKVDWRDAVVTTWGGLRGAVGLALALMVFNETETICERVRVRILFHTSGIVLLTVIVNSLSEADHRLVRHQQGGRGEEVDTRASAQEAL